MKNGRLKKLLSLGLSLAMVLSLAACGGTSDTAEDTDTSSADSGETTEVKTYDTETGFSDIIDWTLYPVGDKPRIIVTTDGEADDMNSMRHLLLYADEFDIVGLIYSASQHHWQGDGEHKLSEITEDYLCKGLGYDEEPGELLECRPQEEGWIEKEIEQYREDYVNLVQNDPDYPTADELLATVKIGNWLFEGDVREETEGSNLIKDAILDDVDQKLFLQSWGGFNTVARALLSIYEEYGDTDQWDEIYTKVCNKVVIQNKEQDTAYKNYIADIYPDLVCLGGAGNQFGYYTSVKGEESYIKYFQADWLKENIKFNHGALMSAYGLLGDGTYYVGETAPAQYGTDMSLVGDEYSEYDWLGEGDSICWVVLLDRGLRGLETMNLGTWGGRLTINGVEENRNNDYKELDPNTGKLSGYSGRRFNPVLMEDWAAKADWAVSSYEDANHAPVVEAENLDLTAAAGETVSMAATVSDPDNDEVDQTWWVYTWECEYDGDKDALDLDSSSDGAATFTLPSDAAAGDYFVVMLEVKDQADAPMTRFAQFVITVE